MEDFEILQNIGKECKDLLITKVRSKIDKNIYCMRKIKIEKGMIPDEDIKNLKEIIEKINHPHIIKYYSVFKYNDYICIIMEYIDTDLKNFIETYQITKRKIKVEEQEIISFLLIQCLDALNYLHEKNYEKYGIRLSNILMPTERGIKLGIIKDTLPKNWKKKDDIILLYKYFELLMFPGRFKPGQTIGGYLSNKENNEYDKKLRDIIWDLDNNPKDVNKKLEKTEQYYIDKFDLTNDNKNTCIKSIFDCFSKYDNFKFENCDNDYKKDLYNEIIKHDTKTYDNSIEKVKRLIALEYPSFDHIKEIDPISALKIILKRDKTLTENKDKKTIISDSFSFKKKYVKKCNSCKDYKLDYQITENILIIDLPQNDGEYNLNEAFKSSSILKDKNEFFCDKCLAYQKYNEEISFIDFNNYLIIAFNRGKNYASKTKVTFPEKLVIKVKNENNSDKDFIFQFKGCINKKGMIEEKKVNIRFEGVNKYDNKSDEVIVLFYQKK